MVTETLKNFDLKQIAQSGQCFRLAQTGPNTFAVIAYGKRLVVRQEGQQVTFYCTEREYKSLWRRYFDLEANYRYFIDHIDPEDLYLTAAARAGDGIRILRQDLWETMVSFIISQNNSIPKIQQSIHRLCIAAGEKHTEADGPCGGPSQARKRWQKKQPWNPLDWDIGPNMWQGWHKMFWTARWTWKHWGRWNRQKRKIT